MAARPTSADTPAHRPEPGDCADIELAQAQSEVSELFGNIAAFWGFTRTQGRIYGLLFLSPAPLTANQIRQRLEISTGSTSMTLTSLQGWGVVHRQGRQFVAETDIWKLITGVFRRRERAEVVDAITRMRAVVDALARVPNPSAGVRFARARRIAARLFQAWPTLPGCVRRPRFGCEQSASADLGVGQDLHPLSRPIAALPGVQCPLPLLS